MVGITKMVTFVVAVLPRVGREQHLKLVRQQHNELVLLAVQQNTKILLHMPLLPVKVVLLSVAVVLDLMFVQHKQNELVQVVHRDIIKIPIHTPV